MPRQACDKTGADGIADIHEHETGTLPASPASSGASDEFPLATMTSGRQRDKLGCAPAQEFAVTETDALLDPDVAPHGPSHTPANPDERLPGEPAIPDRPRTAR